MEQESPHTLEKAASGFDEQILTDLIAQGFSGDRFLAELQKAKEKIRPAVEAMLTQAEQAAYGVGKSYSYEDVFPSKIDDSGKDTSSSKRKRDMR